MALPGLWLPPGFRAKGGPSPIYPTVVGSTSVTGTSVSDIVISTPSGTAVGDLLLIFAVDGAGAARSAFLPSEWVPVYSHTGSGDQRRIVAYSRAASAAGATNVTVKFSGSGVISIRCLAIRNASIQTFAKATGTNASVSSGTMPSLSPPWGATLPTLWIAFAASHGASANPAEFSGWNNYALVSPGHSQGSQLRVATLQSLDASMTPPNFSGSASTHWSRATLAIPGLWAPEPTPAAPDAFTAGQWTADGGENTMSIVLSGFPDGNGALIHTVEYQLDSGPWTKVTGYGISGGISGVVESSTLGYIGPATYSVKIRAKNSAGASAASDAKSVTVTAPEGGGGGGK